MTPGEAAVQRRGFGKADFYRYCRLVHGWLSAIAFLALGFFCITGLLLNHPEWLEGEVPPSPVTQTFALTAAELGQIESAEDPGEALAQIAASYATLRGAYASGERAGPDVFARLQGVRGTTDLRVRLATGALEVVIEPAPAMIVMNELHRAERAGDSWRFFVDAVAVLLIVLSLVGYVIFLGMRFRLRTAMLLTLASTAGMYALFLLAVH